MQKDWLKKRVTVEEVEAAHMIQTDRLGPEPVPFGFQNGKWRSLIDQMEEGDELWTFSSSQESWARLCGCAGIALVRNSEVVNSIVTMMN